MENRANLEEEYKSLNEHRKCLEDMVVEISSRVENLLQKAKEYEEKPKTAQSYLVSAEKEQKRLDALKVSLTLADNELLHIMQLMAVK